jgi:hypothetical protein
LNLYILYFGGRQPATQVSSARMMLELNHNWRYCKHIMNFKRDKFSKLTKTHSEDLQLAGRTI